VSAQIRGQWQVHFSELPSKIAAELQERRFSVMFSAPAKIQVGKRRQALHEPSVRVLTREPTHKLSSDVQNSKLAARQLRDIERFLGEF
jgi:hypothetical protein